MKAIITPKAQKQYQKFPRAIQIKLKKKMLEIEKHPFAGKKLEGDLSKHYSIRVWPYRIIYWINQKTKTFILLILPTDKVFITNQASFYTNSHNYLPFSPQ